MTNPTRVPTGSCVPLEDAIDEGQFIEINGLEQWISLRGRSSHNPALLVLPGPGAGLSVRAPFFAPWERHFTLVQWDQPRAGVTAARHGFGIPENFCLDRIARDGRAVAAWACERLGLARIGLLAFSGGTIAGLKMIKEQPGRFSAYVGTGQIVNWARQDELSYRKVLANARAAGHSAAVTELESLGPPPYPDTARDVIKAKYSVVYSAAEAQSLANLDSVTVEALRRPPLGSRYVPADFSPPKNERNDATAVYDAVRSEILGFDADALGLEFAVPMLFLQGELDCMTDSSEVAAYAERIRAPHKAYVPIPDGGHSPWVMRERYLELLVNNFAPLAGE